MSRLPITMNESIDWLFTRLSGTYGAQWTRQWDGTPMSDVKTAWMHELSGYAGNPSAIKYALDNLPERCPNVIQFRNICRAAPARQIVEIQAPPADQERVKQALAKLSDAPPRVDGKEWARRIIRMHEAGDRVRRYTLSCAQQALGIRPPEKVES